MPGIIGIISKTDRGENDHDLSIMLECMMHEPFYDSGTYIDHRMGIYIGWVCQRNSFSDCMPVFNETKDLVLIVCGENFQDPAVKAHLKSKGHNFDLSNASYMIHLYEESPDDFPRQLNGWFSGVLIDIRKEKIILFNDRYGIQRIYFHESDDEFLFSSEAKSLLKTRPALRIISYKGLGEYLSCGCVLENRTLFSNIFLLPGGSEWTFQCCSCIKKASYFKPCNWENQPHLESEIFYSRLKETFIKTLPRYFDSDEPIGMSLTGGIDTRLIMAGINPPPGSLPCYTFGGMYRDCLDVSISRKVAEACNQSHQVLELGQKFLTGFPKYAEKSVYISDGLLDVCGSYELYLNKLAREIAPIRMTGNYGGEVLRSVRTFKATPPCKGLFVTDFDEHIQAAIETFIEISKGNKLTLVIFKQGPWSGCGRLSVEQSQLIMRTPFMDNELVALSYQAPEQAITSNRTSLRLIQDCNPALSAILTDRGIGITDNPFLFLIRFYYAFLIRSEYYYNQGMPHWLTRIDNMLSPLHLEKLFLGQNKFHHYRVWFRRELAQYVLDVLSDKQTCTRSYLSRAFVEKMVSDHMKGLKNYTSEINMILTIELTQRLLVDL